MRVAWRCSHNTPQTSRAYNSTSLYGNSTTFFALREAYSTNWRVVKCKNVQVKIAFQSPSTQIELIDLWSATVRAARPFPGWTPGVSLVSLVARFDVCFPHFERYRRFISGVSGKKYRCFRCSADDLTFVMTRNFSDMTEMRSVTVHRHRPVVQDSPGQLVSRTVLPDLAHSRVDEIGCLIDSAVVVFCPVGERDD